MARFLNVASYLQIYCWLLALAGNCWLTAGQQRLRSNLELYSEGPGVNPPFEDIRDVIQDGYTGYTGTTIDVNNAAVEGGMYGSNMAIHTPLRLHTLANSSVAAKDSFRWSRWYQTDGATQIFRLFPGEENVRNCRPLAARIETFAPTPGWNYNDVPNSGRGGEWHDWVGRFTIVKPIYAMILQVKDTDADDWSVSLFMSPEGSISVSHRRPLPEQSKNETLIENATGKPVDIRVRDNGLDYEIYLGNDRSHPTISGRYVRNDEAGDTSLTKFRWGMYVGKTEVTTEGMIFISHASIDPRNLPVVSSDLLVGWDTWKSGSVAASRTYGNATGRATESSGNWGESAEAASTDGTFGSLAGASTLVNASKTGTHIGSTTAGGSYDFTITAGVNGLVLTQFSFDAQRKRSGSPFQWSVETIAGAISTGVIVGNGSLDSILGSSGPSNHKDFDLDLRRLSDNVLEPGQSATFRISFSGGTAATDQKTYLDNVGIFGSIVAVQKEPGKVDYPVWPCQEE